MIKLLRLMTDNDQYSKLLSSINIANTGLRRVLSPIEAARLIKQLVEEEGGEKNVVTLLPLSRTSIHSFIRLLNLPEDCHDGIIWGKSDNHGVGFSAASAIATLKKKNDQRLLFHAASDMGISESDVQEIVAFYKKYLDTLSLGDVIKRVVNARPQISNAYIVVISISEKFKAILEDNANKSQKTSSRILESLIVDKFYISPDGVRLKGNHIAIGMNERDYRKYKKMITELKLEYDVIAEYILK